MDYFSCFDGIGAAHAALLPLGYRCVGISEVNKFCNELIDKKYGFKNFGDFTKWKEWGNIGAKVIVASPPCTAFSFIGRRRGTADPAGALTPSCVRFICAQRPRWFILENVPGIFAINEGGLLRWMLNQFSQCGYNCCWRVLNAESFGVPQSRRRMFLVGHLGSGYRAAKVLFDGESIPIPTPQSTGTRQNDLRTIEVGIGKNRYRHNRKSVGTLLASPGGGVERIGAIILDNDKPRWLTVRERERLMGFEDDYTAGFSDAQRHRMTGNSIVVPILGWIGKRLLQQEQEANMGQLKAG